MLLKQIQYVFDAMVNMIPIPCQNVQPQIRQFSSILDGFSHYPVKAHEYEQAVGSIFGLCSPPYVLDSRYPGIEAIPVPKLICSQHLLTPLYRRSM